MVDLAIGHLKALNRHENDAGLHIYNLGTGTGYSVLDMVKAFEQANNIEIPYRLVARRPGDIATCYSDPSLAAKELNWTAERGLEQMMKDTWNWQKIIRKDTEINLTLVGRSIIPPLIFQSDKTRSKITALYVRTIPF